MKTTPLPIELPPSDAAEGGESIIGGLFRSQANRMRRYLTFRLQNAEDAQDATQEVFLKLWRYERAKQLRKEATAYMYSASHTVAIDEERRRNVHERDRIAEYDLDQVATGDLGIEERLHWREAAAHLVNELERLPALTRDVFKLHHFEGLDYSEIAVRLGVSLRTVERHIAAGTKDLRVAMREFL